MTPDDDGAPTEREGGPLDQRTLAPAARRALAEAQARRAEAAHEAAAREAEGEVDGRGGADPVRYGDWEVKGRAVDF